jgi:hypothetical protein
VHELAANAVLHGAGHGRVRLWTQDGYLCRQVSDDGPAGRNGDGALPRALPWPAEHGHGLWIIAQVTGQSSIDRGPAGTTVTARFALPSPPLRPWHLSGQTAQSGPPHRAVPGNQCLRGRRGLLAWHTASLAREVAFRSQSPVGPAPRPAPREKAGTA